MENKIIAVVKFNDEEAFVMERPVELKYTKYENRFIIGTDGCFVNCYYYERPIPPIYDRSFPWQAFGGRKFDLPLTDGTIEHCYGQWWSGGEGMARKILKKDIVSITADDIESLKRCYVFSGLSGIKEEIDKLRKTYKGKVYEYREYDGLITTNIHWRRSLFKEYRSIQFFASLVRAEIERYFDILFSRYRLHVVWD